MGFDDDTKTLLKLFAPIAIAYLATGALAAFVARWFGIW